MLPFIVGIFSHRGEHDCVLRSAALRWANHVSVAREVGVTWRYLLVSETDINTAKGSWPAL
jgi:hypothetical protein